MRFEVHTAGDPESPRLALLLHGFPEHAHSWRHQLPVLAGMGYRVWAPNLRGYGGTTRPRGKRHYRIECLLEDTARLIDASGAEEVTLFGHDWGGIIAWMAALRGIHPLKRLVILNIPHPLRFKQVLATSKAQRRRSLYAVFFQIPWLPERLLRARRARAVERAFRGMAVHPERFPDEDVDVYRNNALQPGAASAMLHYYRANRHLFDDVERLPVLETPTLIVWGEQDEALGIELLEGTEALVKDLHVHRIPDASHWVQQDAPEEVNAAISEWLASPRPSEGGSP